ncbi:hypothetical protein [Chondromyces apiculatus]|uniref:hypothetical protein n=1 Tax=Chondromyces apiculatus TaxID=51 RepID=UPI0005C45806|nr:hypothetical protein [Chondromyces apiculatus]
MLSLAFGFMRFVEWPRDRWSVVETPRAGFKYFYGRRNEMGVVLALDVDGTTLHIDILLRAKTVESIEVEMANRTVGTLVESETEMLSIFSMMEDALVDEMPALIKRA